MRGAEFRRLATTLGMSFLIFLATHQGSWLIWNRLQHLILFILFSLLVLFVVDRSGRFCEAALTCVRLLASFLLIAVANNRYGCEADPQRYGEAEPCLPWRFQLPPPIPAQ